MHHRSAASAASPSSVSASTSASSVLSSSSPASFQAGRKDALPFGARYGNITGSVSVSVETPDTKVLTELLEDSYAAQGQSASGKLLYVLKESMEANEILRKQNAKIMEQLADSLATCETLAASEAQERENVRTAEENLAVAVEELTTLRNQSSQAITEARSLAESARGAAQANLDFNVRDLALARQQMADMTAIKARNEELHANLLSLTDAHAVALSERDAARAQAEEYLARASILAHRVHVLEHAAPAASALEVAARMAAHVSAVAAAIPPRGVDPAFVDVKDAEFSPAAVASAADVVPAALESVAPAVVEPASAAALPAVPCATAGCTPTGGQPEGGMAVVNALLDAKQTVASKPDCGECKKWRLYRERGERLHSQCPGRHNFAFVRMATAEEEACEQCGTLLPAQ
jgi:hypothetical protein